MNINQLRKKLLILANPVKTTTGYSDGRRTLVLKSYTGESRKIPLDPSVINSNLSI
jgi:hypothetical protein